MLQRRSPAAAALLLTLVASAVLLRVSALTWMTISTDAVRVLISLEAYRPGTHLHRPGASYLRRQRSLMPWVSMRFNACET